MLGLLGKYRKASRGSFTISTISFNTNPRIAGVGDSRVNYGDYVYGTSPDGTIQNKFLNGWVVAQSLMANFYGFADSVWLDWTDERFFGGANQGVATKDTAWIRANRYAPALALKPDACFIQAGINNGNLSEDPNAPSSFDLQGFADIVAFYDACRANVLPNGKTTIPIIETALPVGTAIGTGGGKTKNNANAFNKLLRDRFANDPTCIFVDSAFALTGDLYSYGNEIYYVDSLHLNYKGAHKVGQYIATIMSSKITAANWLSAPTITNLLTNPSFTGTTGTLGNARITGTLPTSWGLYSDAGTFYSTCVCSMDTDPITSTTRLNLDITPIDNGGSDSFTLRLSANSGIISLGTAGTLTGKNYILSAGFDIPSNDSRLIKIEPYLQRRPATTTREVSGGNAMNGGSEAGARREWICSPALEMDSTADGVLAQYKIAFNTLGASGSATFRVSIVLPKLFEIAARKAIWGNQPQIKPYVVFSPAISGTFINGNTLTVSTGTWNGTAPITYAYKWLRDGIAISGATANTYTLTSGDVGKTISAEVTAINTYGPTAYTVAGAMATLPPTFDLNTIPNLKVWYDMSDTSTLYADTAGTTLASTTVARINDKSPNAYHALQSTAAKQATTGALLNGKNGLTLDGVNDTYLIPAALNTLTTGAHTILALVKFTSGTGSSVWGARDAGTNRMRALLSTASQIDFTSGNTSALSSVTISNTYTNAQMIGLRANTSTFQGFINGGIYHPNATKTNFTATSFYLGSTGDAANYLNASLFRFAIFDRELTYTEINQILQSWATDFGLTYTSLS